MARVDRPASLTPKERTELATSFSWSAEDGVRPLIRSQIAGELLRQEKCERYLDWLAAYIGAPSRRVAASMLAKRYAYLTVAPMLYAMTMYDKGLKLSLGHCRLASAEDGECGREQGRSRFPDLIPGKFQVTEPAAGGRDEWRQQVIGDIFDGHLTPLLRSSANAGRVPMAILWENAVVRIVPLYEYGLDDADDLTKQRIHEDFDYMARRAPAELFGERRNPLSGFMGKITIGVRPEKRARIRQTCCLYHEMAAEYCRNCPKTSGF